MIYTNKFNIPETIARAIINDPYVKQGDFSATELIKPPQMRVLEKRHADEIEVDVSDGLWRLLGQAVHYVLEQGDHDEVIKEERLFFEIDGVIFTGKPDLYHGRDESVEDYKVTSVYSFLLGDKVEWEAQLNLNRILFIYTGFTVRSLKIHAILRDWQKSRVHENGYPGIPFMTVTVPVWPDNVAMEYLRSRIKLHLGAEQLPDGQLPPCTPEEQWARPDRYAVKKKGVKRAKRLLDSREEAEQYIRDNFPGNKAYEIEFRPGQKTRCEGYCNARDFCHQYRRESAESSREHSRNGKGAL